MKKLFYILGMAIMVAGCSKESSDKGTSGVSKSFEITASLPEDTRLSLSDDQTTVSLTWESTDKIDLVFVQGAVKKSQTASVGAISNGGKTAKFGFTVPEGVDGASPFDLYGVFGGTLDSSDPTNVLLPSGTNLAGSLSGVQSRNDIVLYFQSPSFDPGVAVAFKHVGSLFKVELKNIGKLDLNGVAELRLVGDEISNQNWAYDQTAGKEKFDLVSGGFAFSGTAGNYLSFKSAVSTIPAGGTKTYYAWYAPHDDQIYPPLKVQALDSHGDVLYESSDSKPARSAALSSGKTYLFETEWSGSKLQFKKERVTSGVRDGSATLLFAKKLNADLGIPDGNSTGIALTGNYLAINSRGNNTVYIDAMTGDKVGEFDLGTLKGANTNFYHTSDDAGNILICNYVQTEGSEFKIWKMSSVDAAAEELISWPLNLTSTSNRYAARKFSVIGDVNTNAIITVPLINTTSFASKFLRWQVSGGSLLSAAPEIVTVTLPITKHGTNTAARGWSSQVDIMSTSATNPAADYYINYYGDDLISFVNGTTNTQSTFIELGREGFIGSSLDVALFNGKEYMTVNFINPGTSGTGDVVWLLDVTTKTFNTGNLNAKSSDAIVFEVPRNSYGALAINSTNTTGFADVELSVSEDGYYLYMYFLFNNGYVACYRFDCIQQ